MQCFKSNQGDLKLYSASAAVIWQYFDFIKTTSAAAIWTLWILDIWNEGNPNKRLLQ